MKKCGLVVLAGFVALVGAACGGDGDGGTGGTGGTGATGGTGNTGGGGTGVDICADNGGSGSVDITAEEITENTFFSNACDYFFTRETFVIGATMTVQEGTQFGGDANSALIVTTTGRLEAVGTAESPIVFTSSRAATEAAAGDWGGIVLLGRARLSWGNAPCDGVAGECVSGIEGIAATEPRGEFGGDDDTHDCGTLRYVRIEYAGAVFGPDNELNGLTVAGCGDQTELSYIQVHRGLDDGVEFFGGTASIDRVIVTGTGDDGLDWDQGYRGTVENFIVHHFSSTTSSPNGIEADNFGDGDNNVEPRSAPQVSNGTVIGDGRPEGSGVVTRVGTWGVLDGLVVVGFGGAGYDMRNGAWSVAGGWPDGIVVNNSCFDGNGANWPVDDNDPNEVAMGVPPFFNEPELLADAARNNFEEDPVLGDFSTAATGGMPAPDYTLTNANCLGAFGGPGGDDWTAGWTAYPEGAAASN